MKENRLVLHLCKRFIFGRDGNLKRIRGGVLGIALSLIPLVMVFVVANGMISGITMRFIETGTYHLQLRARNSRSIETIPETINELLQLDMVLHAFPEAQGLGLLAGGRGHNGVQIRGVDPTIYEKDRNFAQYLDVLEGEFDLSAERNLLIGENIALQLDIAIGDQVRLITARTQETESIIPRVSRFTVTGIVSSGYRELDALWVFMSRADAKRIIPANEIREIIGVKVRNPFALDSESRGLQFTGHDGQNGQDPEHNDLLRELRNRAGTKWRLLSWFDLEESQYMSFITTRNLLLFIMVLIVLVAAVNISSAMIMLVLEKQEEVAMLKALGIRNGKIFGIFLIAGGLTGGIGTLIGLSLGALAAYNVNGIIAAIERVVNGVAYLGTVLSSTNEIYIPLELFNPDFYLSKIPVNLHIRDLAIMALISLSLSVLMSYLPARRAVKLNPLNLLHRH